MLVGLTGGIATGKTTASKLFAKHGAIVVSADALGHKALHSTGGAYEEVKDRFGFLPGLLDENDEIDRRVLGYHVFLNPGEMQDLDCIVHPVVSDMFNAFVEKHHKDDENIIIYECAILYEIQLEDTVPFTYVISTWCPFETQVERLMTRNNLDRNQALMRIERQMDADHKRELADFDIDTSVSPEALEMRTKHIYDTMVEMLPIRKVVKKLLAGANSTRAQI